MCIGRMISIGAASCRDQRRLSLRFAAGSRSYSKARVITRRSEYRKKRFERQVSSAYRLLSAGKYRPLLSRRRRDSMGTGTSLDGDLCRSRSLRLGVLRPRQLCPNALQSRLTRSTNRLGGTYELRSATFRQPAKNADATRGCRALHADG